MKRFKTLLFTIGILLLVSNQLKANTDTTKAEQHFYDAKGILESMLKGETPISYEKAIFTLENAYYSNELSFEVYQSLLDIQTLMITSLREKGRTKQSSDFKSTFYESKETLETYYNDVLSNWAIFTFMTDTNTFLLPNTQEEIVTLPFEYSDEDPLATKNWTNSQTIGLFNNGKGNCFAQASLFLIFHSDAKSEKTSKSEKINRKRKNKAKEKNYRKITNHPGCNPITTNAFVTQKTEKYCL